MDIFERLKTFFSELKYDNITAKSVADKLNISYKTLSNYINGERYIPLEHLNSIANMFCISVDYLLGFTTEKQYKNCKFIEKIDATIVGNNIKMLRKEKKLTQEQLAKDIDSTKSNISRYENGKNLILTINFYEICKKYKISADYLLGKVDEPKYLK